MTCYQVSFTKSSLLNDIILHLFINIIDVFAESLRSQLLCLNHDLQLLKGCFCFTQILLSMLPSLHLDGRIELDSHLCLLRISLVIRALHVLAMYFLIRLVT